MVWGLAVLRVLGDAGDGTVFMLVFQGYANAFYPFHILRQICGGARLLRLMYRGVFLEQMERKDNS